MSNSFNYLAMIHILGQRCKWCSYVDGAFAPDS